MTVVEAVPLNKPVGAEPRTPDLSAAAPSSHGAARLDRSFATGIAWLGSVKWLVQLVTWGTTIIVARILTPADYGLLTMGTVLLAFITLVSESGIGITIVTVRDINDEQIAQINGAAVIIGLASFIAACVAAGPTGRFYRSADLPPVIVALSLTLVISSFRTVPGALLQKELRFPRLAVIDAAQAATTALTTIVCAVLGLRYWSLVLGSLVGALVGSTATLTSRPNRISRPRWATLRPVLPFTRDIVIGRLFWFAYQNSDFIVAGKRLGTVALGAYSYAWTLAAMPIDKISALLSSVTPPIFAAVQNDRAALRRYFLTITEGLAVVTFPLTVGIALVANDLVPVVFGQQWLFMIAPLQILALYATVRTISPTASQVLVVTGDTSYMMYVSALAAIVLPAAFIIGSRWGTIGIAIAWTIAHPVAVYLPINVRLFRRVDLRIGAYLCALLPAVSGCLAMAGAVTVVQVLMPDSIVPEIRLGSKILAGACGYSANLLLFHRSRLTAFIGLWRDRTK